MTRSETLTVRCRGPKPLRLHWYRSLAGALSATSGPCGAVFESTLDDPLSRVTVRPGELIDTVEAAPTASTLRIERFPAAPPLEPPPNLTDRIGVVIPLRSVVGCSPRRSDVARDPPRLDRLLPAGGWIGFQTHWVRGPSGELWTTRRFRLAVADRSELCRAFVPVCAAVAQEWGDVTSVPAAAVPGPPRIRRDWRRGTVRRVPRDAWLPRTPETISGTAEVGSDLGSDDELRLSGHGVVFGASGAGKTTFLARLAADAIERRERVVVVDLHGDLAPAIVARLGFTARSRVVAVDAADRPVLGIAALVPGTLDDDRAAAHLVAALKRLSPDGIDLYWGFRLERIFDSFVRLVQESTGSLVDLYGLLTDVDRRDAARLATRRSDLARFLEELGPVVRRHPDFLWSAATRLSKVVLVPALAELLAPADGGVPVEVLLAEGRSVLVRLPLSTLGPEAAAFAGTLVLGRVYLGLTARTALVGRPAPVLLVLDEVHSFPPRLVAEILTESRKFGVRALVATQYPERLVPEVRSAAAGALTEFVTFRVPRPSASGVGVWFGLGSDEAERSLPCLPPGYGIRLDPETGRAASFPPCDARADVDPAPWVSAVATTRHEFSPERYPLGSGREEDRATERILLAILAAEEEGRPLLSDAVVPTAFDLPGSGPERAVLEDRWMTLLRAGYVTDSSGDGLRLTPAGERRLGLGAPTGASRESSDHRLLLLRAFRLFARRGYRIEVVRQGRYDTTLPDALFHQVSLPSSRTPGELAEEVDRARRGWAWRFFGGRDVHIEAEVSGALRPERIRLGWSKAKARGAFALFLVGDAARARRVRTTLRVTLGVGPDRAQVWTLRNDGPARLSARAPLPTNP